MKALKQLLTGTDPKPKGSYAITSGTYIGEFFVYMEKIKGDFMFLSIPKMEIRTVPYDKWVLGVSESIIEEVQKLPDDVYDVCVAQYRKNRDKS